MLKPSQQQRQTAQLRMTAQMRQAIHLLSLPTLELAEELRKHLEENPCLEENELEAGAEEDPSEALATDDDRHSEQQLDLDQAQPEDPELQSEDLAYPEEPWTQTSAGSTDFRDMPEPEAAEVATSLHDLVLQQIEAEALEPRAHALALAMLDALDSDGRIQFDPDMLQTSLDFELAAGEAEAMLEFLQGFDPAGLFARDLQEALYLQLDRLSNAPHVELALRLIESYFDELAEQKLTPRKLGVSEPELQQALDLIRSLDPNPGLSATPTQSEYIVPDLVLHKMRGQWRIELNASLLPRLQINHYYSEMVQDLRDGPDRNYLQDHLRDARWLLDALNRRNDTLLRVGEALLARQPHFAEQGLAGLRPLTQREIAEDTGLHESTISRSTHGRYVQSPHGILELKSLFSSSVATDSGSQISAQAVQAKIRDLIRAETPKRPLSDSQLVEILGQDGIQIARRTVAKYRESLGIAASAERRQRL
ncbi:MAG: RNA polymerase factor sigma-54 [Gammaproteobacteria bacterium]